MSRETTCNVSVVYMHVYTDISRLSDKKRFGRARTLASHVDVKRRLHKTSANYEYKKYTRTDTHQSSSHQRSDIAVSGAT